jgi:ADP-ribose pyrophosphatase YjhB (NUDIX family)
MSKPFVSRADGYVKWLRSQVGHQLIYLVYTTVLVFDETGRILVQRRYDFDWLGLPGGALELGEGLRAGAVREAFEETGIDVSIERLVGVFSHPDYNLLYPNGDQVQQWSVCMVGRPQGGQLTPDGGETLQVEWMPVDEALPQFPPAYQAMVRAALDSPRDATLEPVYTRDPLVPHFPLLRRYVGHDPVILPGIEAVVRNENGDILMARRIGDGRLDIPGGLCDLGETTTAAVIREVREETGLIVEPVRIIGVYSEGMKIEYTNGDIMHGVGVAFECRLTGGTLRADRNEISEVVFLPESELLAQPHPVLPGMQRLWSDIAHPEIWPLIR